MASGTFEQAWYECQVRGRGGWPIATWGPCETVEEAIEDLAESGLAEEHPEARFLVVDFDTGEVMRELTAAQLVAMPQVH